MKKFLTALLVAASCMLFAAPKADWLGIAPAKGGTYEFTSVAPGSFKAKLTKNENKAISSIIACRTFDKVEKTANYAITFKARITGDKPVYLSPLLSWKKDGKVVARHGARKITVKSKEFVTFSCPFKDFGITAGTTHLWQFKLGLSLRNAVSGESSGIEVKDLAIEKVKVTTYFLIAPGKGASYDFKDISEKEFSLKITRNSVNAHPGAIVCSNIDKAIHAQHKLQFSCRVAKGKAPVRVKPIISYMNDKKSVMCWGPEIILKGDTWKDNLLSLDSTFKLADAVYQFRQLKIGVDIKGAKPGTEVVVEFKNVAIVSADAAGLSTGLNEVVVHPVKKKAVIPASDALKVFTHFDNDDLNTVYDGRGRMRHLKDNQPYPGFRYVLFETVQKDVKAVKTPEEADVIVYSAARPDKKMASRIAKAVKSGKHLIAASAVADKEVAELLPVKITKLPEEDFPERKQLVPAKDGGKLFAGLSKARFGVYTKLAPANGARVLCRYSDGSPAMVEGKAGKGRVFYNSVAFGSDLISGYAARDAFLLRTVEYISGKKIPLAVKKSSVPDKDGYYAGAGQNNFGRFGIILGDGLLTEEINNFLAVINNSQEYRFTNSSTRKIKLGNWNFKVLKKGAKSRKVMWAYRYPELSKVEYTSDCVIPADWKGSALQFAVQNGIDDVAAVYFNGREIGRVTKDMSEYWMRPHRYNIPADIIKFGKPNRIKIVAENIRGEGGFGSCPELVQLNPESSRPWKFVPDRVNWLGKGGVVTEENGSKRRFDTSLAFPGIRWDIYTDSVDLELTNVAEYCAYPTSGGIKVEQMKNIQTVPVNWSAPWLLLFKENADHPLLLVFSRKQDKIEISQVGGAVSGLNFSRKGGVGMVTPVWLYGRAPVDTAIWKKSLPSETVARIDFWMKRAFKYPAAAEESFKISGNRVNIRTRFSYIETANDWGVKSDDYAPVSPLAYFAKGRLFESGEVADWKLVTSYGNYAARDRSNTVNWSLPLPDMEYRTIPGTDVCGDLKIEGNKVFRNGLRWSCGGRVPASRWTLDYPVNKDFPECFNIGMHGWLMGINQSFIAPYDLDDASTAGLRQRTRKRFFEAVEFAQYKAVQRWREEPMSGIRYCILFPNRHAHATKYAPGTGTSINYADCNETVYMVLSLARMLADRHGQKDFVLANQSYLKDAVSLLMVSDDWGYMACHCRESGLSATIDMLNCEYAAMMSLARIAEIIGDDSLKAQALYRAARRMVPTYTRLIFKDYAVKNKLVAYADSIAFGVGFTEHGFSYRTKGKKPVELDLFDTSQGVPEELADFYEKHAPAEIGVYFNDFVTPTLYGKDGRFQLGTYMLGIAGKMPTLSSSDAEKLARAAVFELDKKFKKLHWDWPGMCFQPYLSQVLFRMAGKVKLYNSEDVDITRMVYDPAKRELMIEVAPGEKPQLKLETSLIPKDKSLKRNGNIITVPVTGKGKRTIKIAFEK